MPLHFILIFLSIFSVLNAVSAADITSVNQRILLDIYRDNNQDLLADAPSGNEKVLDPPVLIVSFIQFEGRFISASSLINFKAHLENCIERKVIFTQSINNKSNIFALRNGRIHISEFSAGTLIEAVQQGGAIPFATSGVDMTSSENKLTVIVRSDSQYYTLSDLKNKRVAHTDENSLSGHLAAFYLLPSEGLTPEIDYNIIFSGRHVNSIRGVKSGDYDAAIVASNAIDLMTLNKEIEPHTFRTLYQSPKLKSTAFAYAHNLNSDLKSRIKTCFFNYAFSDDMKKTFFGDQKFIPIEYKTDWKEVLKIIPNLIK